MSIKMENVCMLCCFTYNSEEAGPSSAAGGNNLHYDLQKCHKLEEFCKELDLNWKELVAALKTEWRNVSICEDCLESVGKAVERGKVMQELEVIVRSLQLELLEKMRNLKVAVDKWQRELRKVVGIVKESEEDVLLCRRKVGDCKEDAVVNFRKLISQAPAKLNIYSGKLVKLVGGAIDVGKHTRGTPLENLLDAPNSQLDLAGETVTEAAGGGNSMENTDKVPEEGSTPVTASCSYAHLLQCNAQTKGARRVNFASIPTTFCTESPASSSGVSVGNNDQYQQSDSCSSSSHNDLIETVVILNALASGTCSPTLSSDSAYTNLETLERIKVNLIPPAASPVTSSVATTLASTSMLDVSGIKSERVDVTQNYLLKSGSGGRNEKCSVRRSVQRTKYPLRSSSNGASTTGKQDIPRPAVIESSASGRCNNKKRNKTQKTHVPVKMFNQSKWECKNCGKMFPFKYKLLNHMRIHTGERPYQCGQCDKKYCTKGDLNRHAKYIHLGQRPFVCDICHKTFFEKINLINHRRTHTGDKPYVCPLCQLGFVHKSSMVFHMRVHSGETPYRCSDCGCRFREECSLKYHQRKENHGIETA